MRALLNLIRRVAAPLRAANRPALFLRVRRTAGTSLVALARTRYAQSMVSHGDWDGLLAPDIVEIDGVGVYWRKT